MSEQKRNIVVGATAVLGLVCVAVLMTLFGGALTMWTERGYDIRVMFEGASGLNAGSRVKLSGVDVGRITAVNLPDRGSGVIVTAQIKKNIRLPQGIRARVEQPLLGGTPALQLDVAPRANAPEINWDKELDRSVPLKGELPTLASELARQLKDAIAEPMVEVREFKTEFKLLSTKFQALSDEWTQVGKNINQLTEPRGTADVDAGNKIGNLATVMARTDERLRELQRAIAGINKYVEDEDLRKNIRTASENIAKASGMMEQSMSKFDKLADETRDNVTQLSRRFIALADDLSREVSNTGRLVTAIREGEGTAGKFVKDPALYNNLNDTVKRINEAMTELRVMLDKWTKEGVQVQF